MKEHELKRLTTRINELRDLLTSLADGGSFKGFISIVHKPGFTTVAEVALFIGVVDSMLEQTKAVLALKQVLLSAAAKVELNPQPLPPKEDLNPQPLPP
jgi:hypothetical protein